MVNQSKETLNKKCVWLLIESLPHWSAESNSRRPLKNIEEHKKILEAIKSGDGSFAESIAKHHVRNARDNALKKIQKGGM